MNNMKGVKNVETVTSNEGYVRMRIYEGELTADEAVVELLRIEIAQHEATRSQLLETQESFRKYIEETSNQAEKKKGWAI